MWLSYYIREFTIISRFIQATICCRCSPRHAVIPTHCFLSLGSSAARDKRFHDAVCQCSAKIDSAAFVKLDANECELTREDRNSESLDSLVEDRTSQQGREVGIVE